MGHTVTSIAEALTHARDRFASDNPLSLAAYDRATAAMPGGNTRTTLYYRPFPLTMCSAAGSQLTDVDGHSYIDLLGEYTAGLYGHSNVVIRAAVDDALNHGWNFGAHGVNESKLAKLLCERFPSLELVRFTNSGTEANLLALATAVASTRRHKILVFDGAYHGSILSFGDGGIPINAPHEWLIGTYNDIAGTTQLVDENAADLAAILVEPMIGSGGCIPADPGFLYALRAAADRTGALLIFDEVMTSRMSTGGQQKRLEINPDLTTLGKYIGGGMSFGAFGGRRDLMSMYDPRELGAVPHSGTFNNNVLSMAAGYAGLSQIFTAGASEALFARGERLRHNLNDSCRAVDAQMQWTGLGSLLTVHFQRSPIHSPADLRSTPDLHELFHLDMLAQGFYLASRGMAALSLEITDDDCAAFCSAVEAFRDAYAPLLEAKA